MAEKRWQAFSEAEQVVILNALSFASGDLSGTSGMMDEWLDLEAELDCVLGRDEQWYRDEAKAHVDLLLGRKALPNSDTETA